MSASDGLWVIASRRGIDVSGLPIKAGFAVSYVAVAPEQFTEAAAASVFQPLIVKSEAFAEYSFRSVDARCLNCVARLEFTRYPAEIIMSGP
jgi:hypothetical protein